jgi:hypothetical protein
VLEAPPDGHRGGYTYDHHEDFVRLNRQAYDVWRVMVTGQWYSLSALSEITGHPEASVSARLRDFRKKRFGHHTVEHMRVSGGFWLYRLLPNPGCEIVDPVLVDDLEWEMAMEYCT